MYVVVDGSVDKPKYVTRSRLKPPAAYDFPNALAWYREQVVHVLEEFKASACGVKTAEPVSQARGAGVAERHNIEGVLMEAVASSNIKCIIGPWKSMGALLESKTPKKYVDSNAFRGMDNWLEMTKEYREAALASVAALTQLER